MKCKGTLFILSAVVFAAAPAFAGSQPVPAGHPTPLEKPPKVDVPAPDKDAGVRRAEGASAAWQAVDKMDITPPKIPLSHGAGGHAPGQTLDNK